MRFKNGSPITLYAVTSQVDGETVVFTSLKARKAFLKDLGETGSSYALSRLATYDLRDK